jgi:hypothetical protein
MRTAATRAALVAVFSNGAHAAQCSGCCASPDWRTCHSVSRARHGHDAPGSQPAAAGMLHALREHGHMRVVQRVRRKVHAGYCGRAGRAWRR